MLMRKAFLWLLILCGMMASWARAEEAVPRKATYIALTFDDGPHRTLTSRLLDIFAKYESRGTFFVLGKNAARYPEILERMVAEGHALGNHTYEHERLTGQSHEERKAAVDPTQKLIEAAGYRDIRLFRPPYGALDDSVREFVRNRDYTIIWWSYSVSDYKLKDAVKVSDKVMDTSTGGDIILLHDIHESTVDAVEIILSTLIPRGYRFVTLPELITIYGKELGDQFLWRNAR